MSKRKSIAKRRNRLSIEPLEPRRLLDVSGVWQELGFRSASGGGLTYDGLNTTSVDPVGALTPDGRTVVAYDGGSSGVHVRMFDGKTWIPLPDPGASVPSYAGIDGMIDIAVDDFSNIYLCWWNGADVYLTKGSLNPATAQWTWSGLGGSAGGGGVSNDGVANGPGAVAVGVDGLPVVAYSAYDAAQNDMDIVAKKYRPELNQWVELTGGPDFLHGGGGVSNDALASAGWVSKPQAIDLAIGGDNAPIVAWSSTIDSSHPAEIYARRWNQVTGKWDKIGGESASDPTQYPAVAGVSNTPYNSIEPHLAIRQDPGNPGQDIVLLAWRDQLNLDDSDQAQVYIKRLIDATPVTGSWGALAPNLPSNGLILDFAGQRDLSLDIGSDGLPLIGLTRLQMMTSEQAIDATTPWSTSNWLTATGSIGASNWYAWGAEAYWNGSSVQWRWLGNGTTGATASTDVTQARGTAILELHDGSPLLLFGEDPWAADTWNYSGPSGRLGGPWDPGSYPAGAVDPEVYARRWDASTQKWVNYGEGSGDQGGIDNDIRWNSDPILATAGDGHGLVAYAERIGTQVFIRVKFFNDATGKWENYGTGLPTGINISQAEMENYTYRWDEVVIASDPAVSVAASGRPVVAYLDYINTDDPTVDQKGTITVWAYDENEQIGTDGKAIPGTGTWQRLGQYAAVTAGTVWDGYLIDQIELIAGPDNKAYLAWRDVDPTVERDDPDVDLFAHVSNVTLGGRQPYDKHGRSEIIVRQWSPSAGAWQNLGGLLNPFEAMKWNRGLNFDPTLVLTPDRNVWLSFSSGRMSTSGLLVCNIELWEFSIATNAWIDRHDIPADTSRALTSSIFVPDSDGQSYGHPQLALGADQRPTVVWEDQQWKLNTLQDMGVLQAYGSWISNDPNDRDLWADDKGLSPQWRLVIPNPVTYDEPLSDANNTFATAELIRLQESPYAVINGSVYGHHAIWSVAEQKWVSQQDWDYYRVDGLVPNGKVLVTLTTVAGTLEPRLDVYNETGVSVGTATAPADDPTPLELYARADNSGSLVFSITGRKDDGATYTIEVKPDPTTLMPMTVLEAEDQGGARNDPFGNRQILNTGYLLLEGSLDSATDRDYFEIQNLTSMLGGEPNTYKIEITAQGNWRPLLGEFLPFGTLVSTDGATITVPVWGGKAFFGVTGRQDITFTGSPHDYGRYTVKITPTNDPEVFDETDIGDAPNTLPGMATPVNYFSPKPNIKGTLPTLNDVDFYKLGGLSPEGLYLLECESLIRAYDTGDLDPADYGFQMTSGTKLYLRADTEGKMLVSIQGKQGDGTYTLKVTPVETMPSSESFTERMWYDDNDSYANRNLMPPPTQWVIINGNLNRKDPTTGDLIYLETEASSRSDYYEVRLPGFNASQYPNGGWVEIILSNIGADVDPGIRYYHDDGSGTPVQIDEAVEDESEGEPWNNSIEVQSEIDPTTNELVVRFEVFAEHFNNDGLNAGYTVEVRWVIDAYTIEDGFQELTGSAIQTAHWSTSPTGSYWRSTGSFTPEAGYAYVLPEVTSAAGLEPFLTFTRLQLEHAGFTTTQMRQWKLDLESKTWAPVKHTDRETASDVWYSIDLGLRSYFNGDFGGQGDGYTGTGRSLYSDMIASYWEPRIMYGARHVDFEAVWYRNFCGWGDPGQWYTINDVDGSKHVFDSPGPRGWVTGTYDDYRTPLPGDSEINGSSLGWQADGHVAGSSAIYALRYNGVGWEQINSQDALGQTLPSASGFGLNAMVGGVPWSAGFISSVGVRGSGPNLLDAQPIVAWNQAEKNLIHVRGWAPESTLPSLEVSGPTGTIGNGGILVFATQPTGTDAYKTLVLKNTGNDDLTIGEISIAGSAAFRVTNVNDQPLTGPITIAPNGDFRIRVHANSAQAGSLSGMLYIASNDPLVNPLNNNWYMIGLSGSAVNGSDIAVSEAVGIPNDMAVTFGLLEPGETATRSVRISNTGTGNLTLTLAISGAGQGFRLAGDSVLTLGAGASADVGIIFEGTNANQRGALGLLVITHDDYGSQSQFVQAMPYRVQLVGNMPSLMGQTLIGNGTAPAATLGTVAYSNTSGGLALYDIDAGATSGIADGVSSRARSDGNFTVYSKGGVIYLYDRADGATVNLLAGLTGITGAINPSIDGRRVVFAADGAGGHDIHVIDLNVDGNGHVVSGNPVAGHRVIGDINPANPGDDDYADVSGDQVVWRRSQGGVYRVYEKNLVTGDVAELSVGVVNGPRIPRISGDYVVWVEQTDGGNRVVLYNTAQGPRTLFWQQAQMSDEVAISGDLLVWADKRNGNFDLFGYFLPGASQGVDVRGRTFQLTFGANDETSPDVAGSWVAWQATEGGIPRIYYAGVSAAADISVKVDGVELANGGTINFNTVYVDVDGSYVYTKTVEIGNLGTGMLNIEDVIARITSGSANLQVILPSVMTIHQGGDPIHVELRLVAANDGPVGGTVTIGSNDAVDGTFVVNVEAQAIEPTLSLVESPGSVVPLVGLNLGAIEAGQSSTRTFYIRNDATNGAPLVIAGLLADHPHLTIALVQASSTGSMNAAGHYVLDPGEYARYDVTWTPPYRTDALGLMNASIAIASNDVETPTQTLALVGTAYGLPHISVLNASGTSVLTSLDFGLVLKGQSADQGFMIRNDGLEPLTIMSIGVTDPSVYSVIYPSGWTGSLAPGASAVFGVRFSPDAPTSFPAQLLVLSNDASQPVSQVTLAGQGYVVPEITVLHGGLSLASGSSTIQAASTVVGSQWTSTITIRNDNEGELVISAWALAPASGTPEGVFTIAPISGFAGSDGKVHLTQGAQIVVPISFTPSNAVAYPGGQRDFSASLTITNNDGDENPFQLTLAGKGQAPVISTDASPVNFGNVQRGDTATRSFTITNTGLANLVLSQWSSSNPAVFSISPANAAGSGDDVILAPGQSTTVLLSFSPTAIGSQTATLTFASNDVTTPDKQIIVNGQGVAGTLTIQENSGQPNDNKLEFGNVLANAQSTLNVTIRNTGLGTLSLTSWTSDNPAFTLVPPTANVTLASGASTTLQVVFTPTAVQVYSGHITIQSDDPQAPQSVVTVTGTGTGADIVVLEQSGQSNDDRLVFGDAPTSGSGVTQVLTIRNAGSSSLTISGVQVVYAGTSQDLGYYTLLPSLSGGLTLGAGQETQVQVKFKPTQAGDFNATLRIFSSDPDQPTYSVDLIGRGVEPDIAVLENSGQYPNDAIVEFGAAKVGTSVDVPVTIQNVGYMALSVTSWTSTNPAFQIIPASPSGLGLAHGQTTLVTLRYTPTAQGNQTGEIRIVSNDPDHPTYTIAVRGAGLAPAIAVAESSGIANDNRVDFGDVYLGQTASIPIVVQNIGQAPLVLSSYESTHMLFAVTPTNGTGASDNVTIQPGQSVTLNVTFTPTWPLNENAVITIVSDAANGTRYAITATGRGAVQPLPADFNKSGQTDMADYLALKAVFGSKAGDGRYSPVFDLAGPDGVIDFADLAVFAGYYGQSSRAPTKSVGSAKPVVIDAGLGAIPSGAAKASADEARVQVASEPATSVGVGDSAAEQEKVVQDLTLATDMGAVPVNPLGMDPVALLNAFGDAEIGLDNATARPEVAAATADEGVGSEPSPVTEAVTMSQMIVAASTHETQGDPLGIADLVQVDSLVAPYASALLPS